MFRANLCKTSSQKLNQFKINKFPTCLNKITFTTNRKATTNITNILLNHQRRNFSLTVFFRGEENDHHNNNTTTEKNPAEVLFNNGMDEYSMKNFPKALEHFVHAEELEPNNPSIVFQLANTLEMMGKYQEGMDEYSRFIEIYESALNDEYRSYYADYIVKAWLGAGNCVKSMDKYEDAVQHYSKVLEFKENLTHSFGYYNRASCYFQLGKFREAIQDFTEMINVLTAQDIVNDRVLMTATNLISSLDPSVCYYFKALCHMNLGEFEPALSDLSLIINDFEKKEPSQQIKQNVLNNDEVRFKTYYTRAECYLRTGDFERCIQDTDTVIGIVENFDSANSELLSNLHLTKADLHFEMKNFDTALECCMKGVQMNPDNSRALFTASILFKLLKQDDQALNYLRRVIELEPDNAQAKEILSQWESKEN